MPENRAQRLIYTSSPDRGLEVLLDIWPRIKAKAPDAVFSFCYADVYDRIADEDATVGAFRERLKPMMDQPGVQPLGSLSQPDVAHLMRTSMVWAHPSWDTINDQPFHETSCIGAMEAQAAGCLAVASEWGALPETVRVGRLIGQEAPSDAWREAFTAAIVEGLTDPDVQEWAADRGPKQAPQWTWAGVAEQIGGLIEGEAPAFTAHYPLIKA